jgi:hypothetical protein
MDMPKDEQFFREIEEFAGRRAKELKLEEPVIIYTAKSIGGCPLDMTISLEREEDYE